MPVNISPGYLKSLEMIRACNSWLGEDAFSLTSMGVSTAGGCVLAPMASEAVGWSVLPEILLEAGPFLCFENSKERGLVMSLKQPTMEQVKELARVYSCGETIKQSVSTCKNLFGHSETFRVPRIVPDAASDVRRCKFCQISNVSIKKGNCLLYEGIVAWHPPCDNCRLSLVGPIGDFVAECSNRTAKCILEHLQSALRVYSAFPNEVETPLLALRRGAVGLEASIFLPGRHARFDANSSPFSLVPFETGDVVLAELLPVFEVLDCGKPDASFFQTSALSPAALEIASSMARSPLSGLHMYEGGTVVRSPDRLLCDDLRFLNERSSVAVCFEIVPMWTRPPKNPKDPTHRHVENGITGSVLVEADVRSASNLHAYCAEVRERKSILPFQFRFTNAHMASSQKIRQLMRIASSYDSAKTVFSGKLCPSPEEDYSFVFLALSTRHNEPLDCSVLSPDPGSSHTFSEWRLFDVFTDPLAHLSGLAKPPWRDMAVRTHALSSCIVDDSKLIAHLKTHFVSYRNSTFFDRMMSGGGKQTAWKSLTPDVIWREVDCGGAARILVSCKKRSPGEWGKIVFVYESCGALAEIGDRSDISNMQKLRLIQEKSLSNHNAFFFRCFGSNETFLSSGEFDAFLKLRKAKRRKMDIRALVCSFDNSQEGCITIDRDTAFPYYRWGNQYDNRSADDKFPKACTALSLAIGLSRFVELDDSPIERMDERYSVKTFFFKIMSGDQRTKHLSDLLPVPHTLRVDGVREGCLRVLNAYFVVSCSSLPVSGFPRLNGLSNDTDGDLCTRWSDSLSKSLSDGETCGLFTTRRGLAMKGIIDFFRTVVTELHTSEASKVPRKRKRKERTQSSLISKKINSQSS